MMEERKHLRKSLVDDRGKKTFMQEMHCRLKNIYIYGNIEEDIVVYRIVLFHWVSFPF